ncbi:histone H2A, sperm-like [Culicoides brevitarsis]|uniref:histone H2A, sperm-like n=1 Tax=Culicoides brevitarsis TaxID=469753 RepID=UPI00307B7434
MTPRAKTPKAQSITPPTTPVAKSQPQSKSQAPKPVKIAQKSLTKGAELQFNVYPVLRKLKKRTNKKVRREAGVYAAAVIEYLVAEVLELSGDMARRHKKSRLSPRFIMLAIRTDEELNQIFGDVDFAEGGVIPHIHSVLLPKKTTRRRRTVEAMEPETNTEAY